MTVEVHRRRLKLALIGWLSFVAGMLEAAVMVCVAGVAVRSAAGDERVPLPFGGAISPTTALCLAAVLLLAKLVVVLGNAHVTASLAAATRTRMRMDLLRAFLAAAWSVQARERPGDLQEILSTHADRVTNRMLQFAQIATSSLNLTALLAAALVVNPFAALGVGAAGAVLFGAFRPLSTVVRRLSYRTAASGRTFSSLVAETVTVTREVRTFAVAPRVMDHLWHANAEQARTYRKTRFIQQAVPQLYQVTALLLAVGVIAAVSVDSSPSRLAEVGAVVLLLVRSTSYGQALQSSYTAYKESGAFVDQVWERLEHLRASAAQGGDVRVERIGEIAFEDVAYTYENGLRALAGVTLNFHAGEQIGIVGASGSGKTTLIQVLLRLREPTAGALLIDGRDARELDLESWYSRVGFVPQEAQLVGGTVHENIAFFRDVSRAEVERAARLAHIHETIASLPQGYETDLGGVSLALSGGQRQRICIARALVGEPLLLVFDEPTSALDPESERAIQSTLEGLRGHATAVIIAHRPTTLRSCDRIVGLEAGRANVIGRADDLADDESPYYSHSVRVSGAAS